MFYKNEKSLLNFIKFGPVTFIILLSIITIYLVEESNNLHFQEEVERTKKLYINFNNEELEEEINRVYNYTKKKDETTNEALKHFLKKKVYEAHDIATKIYEANHRIKSNKEILSLIRTALGSIIYNNGRGYYFINDIDGINLLQPLNKKIEDTNILHLKDVNGYEFMKTINQSIKDKSERFDTYYWYKNDKDNIAYEKLSFYKFFEPLNISIGTGEYLVDFENELKKEIIQYVQEIELNDNGYIFVFHKNGEMLAHKNKDTIGTNVFKRKDKIGEKFINVAENGGGFVSYYNDTLNQKTFKKTSFVREYTKWGWIFGTGYNNQELISIITESKQILIKKNKRNKNTIWLIGISITIFLIFVSIFLSRYLKKILTKYKSKLQNEEKEFKNLFEYSNVGSAICNENGKLIKVNSKFIQMLGYENESNMLNILWNDLSNNKSNIDEEKLFEDLLNGRISTYQLEKIYEKEDKTEINVLITANVFNHTNEIKNILFSVVDISEIKSKDIILFQQSKMASMGTMIENIAHQWRQPLSLISTASSGLRMHKEYDMLTDEYLYESVDAITNTTQYLSQTIDDFKHFFKPEDNQRIFSIKKAIDKTKKLISSNLNNKEIQFIETIKDIEILSYENNLIQVLMNILNNAKDALEIVENEKLIFISTHISSNKELIISIKDNAGGIPKDVINKIFEPYFTTKHQSQGTGIGLYMVNEIIQKHMKGRIEVLNTTYRYKNAKYCGAEFTIVLPLS